MTTPSNLRGEKFASISEQEFFDPKSDFWLKGPGLGGGPPAEYLPPQEIAVAGKRAMKQVNHPTPDEYKMYALPDSAISNYIWLGSKNRDILLISFYYNDKSSSKDLLLHDFDRVLSSLRFP